MTGIHGVPCTVAPELAQKRPDLGLGIIGTGAENDPREPVPAAVKVIEEWIIAADLYEGKVFRPVNKADRVAGTFLADEKAIWQVVVHYVEITSLGKLAPHDLRRSCAKLCRKVGGDLEQIQLLLGHASVQTTERCLGTDQNPDG